MTPIQEWLRATDRFKKAQQDKISALLKAEQQQIPPDNLLRPAEPADITIGQIIWYKDGDNGPFWTQVYEPFEYMNYFKAYEAHDGCSYGLDGAFIEIPDKETKTCASCKTEMHIFKSYKNSSGYQCYTCGMVCVDDHNDQTSTWYTSIDAYELSNKELVMKEQS